MRVRFQFPDGRSFRQFDMPGIPRTDEQVIYDGRHWIVRGVAWDLVDISLTEVTVFLKEA